MRFAYKSDLENNLNSNNANNDNFNRVFKRFN